MNRDEQSAEFVEQRWPVLVRSAVLLGCSRHEAEDVVRTALVRCYVAWRKVAAARDRDAYAYRVLVNTHRDIHRRRFGCARRLRRRRHRHRSEPFQRPGGQSADSPDAGPGLVPVTFAVKEWFAGGSRATVTVGVPAPAVPGQPSGTEDGISRPCDAVTAAAWR
jgi:DNA-directed RNA polymerase specialized sigma24 family protein